MSSLRMLHLVTVAGAFQGRVIAARLGSEGIVTSLRGAVDGPYPFGDVLVFVDAEDIDLARQLLLADEVEEAFRAGAGGGAGGRNMRSVHPWLAVAAIVFVAVASSLARVVTL